MRFAPFFLALISALVLFSGLGRIGYSDIREARDAEVARELIRSREVLTPLYGREPLFEKPIFAYAPEVVIRLFARDPSEVSRLFRAVTALLLLILTASIGAEHFGARAGWCSALVLGTTFLLPLASRTDGTQLLATLFGWAGCAGFADALFGRRAGLSLRLVVAWAALAAALVCAGPLPAHWPLLAIGAYVWLARARDGWSRIRPLAGGADDRVDDALVWSDDRASRGRVRRACAVLSLRGRTLGRARRAGVRGDVPGVGFFSVYIAVAGRDPARGGAVAHRPPRCGGRRDRRCGSAAIRSARARET
jgi:hypothetical protein